MCCVSYHHGFLCEKNTTFCYIYIWCIFEGSFAFEISKLCVSHSQIRVLSKKEVWTLLLLLLPPPTLLFFRVLLWCLRFVIISTSQNFTPPKKQKRRRPVQVRAVMWCSPICLQRSTQRQEHERLLLPVFFFFSEVKPFVSQTLSRSSQNLVSNTQQTHNPNLLKI